MTKISCYHTLTEDLAKTFCKLTEKCYYSNSNTLVITRNDDYSKSLDRSLWTYSKKHFIPHATTEDTRSNEQPVFITTKIENPNDSEIIIFVNAHKEIILESIAKNSKINLNKINKLIFLYDETQKTQNSEIKKIIDTSQIKVSEMNFFIKSPKGLWQESAS